MKTSNKILISFFIFQFIGIIVYYVGSRYYYDTDNFVVQEKSLPHFTVIVAESKANFKLKTGKKNKIIQKYLKIVTPNFASYEVRNDTLFVDAVKNEHSKKTQFKIIPEVFCINIKSIILKNKANISMDTFKANSLQIKMKNSYLVMSKSEFTAVGLQAVNSYIRIDSSKIENLKIDLQKSTLYNLEKKQMTSLAGGLKNNSEVMFSIPSASINLSSDKSCTYRAYF